MWFNARDARRRAAMRGDARGVRARTQRFGVLTGWFYIAFCLAQAKAFLGFGENKEEKYTAETTAIIAQVKATLEMAPGAEGREESINQTRQMTNAWVAKYRRDNKTTGKPSYGQVYSALNAVSGHFNNFGTKYPFPAKRKDRVFAEFESAELLLSRGR